MRTWPENGRPLKYPCQGWGRGAMTIKNMRTSLCEQCLALPYSGIKRILNTLMNVIQVYPFSLCMGRGGLWDLCHQSDLMKRSCANEQIHSIVKCVTNLKKSAVCLERSLQVSFQSVRGKLDVLWNDLESIKHVILGSVIGHDIW
jgi:hypothetical protein